LNGVHGDGATLLEQKSGNGIVQTSSGDRLDVAIRQSSSRSSSGSSSYDSPGEIDTAVQQGHVIATRTAPARPVGSGGMERDRAIAEKLTYDGKTQRMMLSGSVEMQNSDGMLWADRVAVEQKTGDAAADGSVKASYRSGTQGDALHVLAGRADLKKASNTAIFYGLGGQPARLWQGGSQIEAPVLEFDRGRDQLRARGGGDGSALAVRTALMSAGSAKQGVTAASPKTGVLRKAAVVRIGSREMIYSDEAHTAKFTGGVKVESADGVMRGQQATAYLQSGPGRKDAVSTPGSGFMNGGVERVVVDGEIEIEQSGRRATGDRLIYTADDGVFVLTGTDAEPPRVMDATRGTVTGRELRFREQDESVVISNGGVNGTSQRVRTETRVKRER
jgi:lipopolysaccharide export system protein LptA